LCDVLSVCGLAVLELDDIAGASRIRYQGRAALLTWSTPRGPAPRPTSNRWAPRIALSTVRRPAGGSPTMMATTSSRASRSRTAVTYPATAAVASSPETLALTDKLIEDGHRRGDLRAKLRLHGRNLRRPGHANLSICV
jgi:hypothetical protein